MNIFNFSPEEIFCFFAVMVRYSVLIAVMPFVGDRMIPAPAKVLLALAATIALFPTLLASGQVRPADAAVWSASAGGIVGTIALETLFGLALGFSAKLLFDSVSFGANLVGNFMGFASASTYDPHQESQTQVVAEIQTAIAMLLFLSLDGHHLMLKASLDSYRIVGVGKANLGAITSQRLITMTSEVIRFAIQIAAPVAISLFAVNVAFGVLAKALPQLNILVLSFSVTALVGLLVLFMTVPEFQGAVGALLGRIGDWMDGMSMSMAGR